MKDVSLYESFLAELRKKIPQGAKLTNTLVDMLYIEREAVYRRLLRRGPVHVYGGYDYHQGVGNFSG